VTEAPQRIADRKLVPIPKQITSTFRGGRPSIASGRWAIILVAGDSWVMPMPLTRRCFSRPEPAATTVAV
jgi:hypothetical protein